MRRKIILEGEMADKFGSTFYMKADSYQEILKCIDANRPGFKKYLLECAEKDVGFTIDMAGTYIDKDEELLTPLATGDVVITPIPSGSKSGIGKIIAAIALVALIVYTGGAAALASAGTTGATFGATMTAGMAGGLAGLSGLQLIGLSLATNLAIAGIQQMMAPDPSIDKDSPTAYLFNGASNNSVEGDPVPIFYGELRLAGRPIALDVINNTYRNNNTIIDSYNNLNMVSEERD
tara:strand:+ start:11321 stop:12025 length:705 start_codon:yes stop_codon:yes gene_type:complete